MSATLNAPDTDWRRRATCRGRWDLWDYDEKETYTADETRRAEDATWTCINACPVYVQCRRDILTYPEGQYAAGIVAGMTPAQRRAERDGTEPKRRRKPAGLPPQRKAVLWQRRAGLNNAQIAALLGMDKRTVDEHVAALRRDGYDLDHLKAPVTRGACGTDRGRNAHGKQGERLCDVCRTGGKETAA